MAASSSFTEASLFVNLELSSTSTFDALASCSVISFSSPPSRDAFSFIIPSVAAVISSSSPRSDVCVAVFSSSSPSISPRSPAP